MTPQETKIQEVINQYRALGWHSVTAVEIEGHKWPIIALWPDSQGKFTAHLDLAGDEPRISSVSLFCNKPLGMIWYNGHDLTPTEVQAIIRLVKGEVVEIEVEQLEAA